MTPGRWRSKQEVLAGYKKPKSQWQSVAAPTGRAAFVPSVSDQSSPWGGGLCLTLGPAPSWLLFLCGVGNVGLTWGVSSTSDGAVETWAQWWVGETITASNQICGHAPPLLDQLRPRKIDQNLLKFEK